MRVYLSSLLAVGYSAARVSALKVHLGVPLGVCPAGPNNGVFECPAGYRQDGSPFFAMGPTGAYRYIGKKDTFRFMHWNTKYLWCPRDPANPSAVPFPRNLVPGAPQKIWEREYPVEVPGKTRLLPTPDEHIGNLARKIAIYRPDVANFVEIQGCNVMSRLSQEVSLYHRELFGSETYHDGTLEPFSIDVDDHSTGQNIGMLSNISPEMPLKRPVPGLHRSYYTIFKLPYVVREVVVIGLHLTPPPTAPGPAAVAASQSRADKLKLLATFVQQQLSANRHVIVAGDMNEFDGQTLDVQGHLPEVDGLKVLYDIGLINVAQFVSQSRRHTFGNKMMFKGQESDRREAIDQVFISQGLVNRVKSVRYPVSDSDLMTKNAFCLECINQRYSDHLPIIIDFKLKA